MKLRGGVFVEFDGGSFQRDAAALRHGFAGVFDEAGEDLFDLDGVYLDGTEGASGMKENVDILRNAAIQQIHGVLDDFVEIEDFGENDLAAAEGEELVREDGGLLRGIFDFGKIAAERGFRTDKGSGNIAIAHDDAEKIVEVVSHAAGEIAYRFHLVGLAEASFHALGFGDVHNDGKNATDAADVDQFRGDFSFEDFAARGFQLGAEGGGTPRILQLLEHHDTLGRFDPESNLGVGESDDVFALKVKHLK